MKRIIGLLMFLFFFVIVNSANSYEEQTAGGCLEIKFQVFRTSQGSSDRLMKHLYVVKVTSDNDRLKPSGQVVTSIEFTNYVKKYIVKEFTNRKFKIVEFDVFGDYFIKRVCYSTCHDPILELDIKAVDLRVELTYEPGYKYTEIRTKLLFLDRDIGTKKYRGGSWNDYWGLIIDKWIINEHINRKNP